MRRVVCTTATCPPYLETGTSHGVHFFLALWKIVCLNSMFVTLPNSTTIEEIIMDWDDHAQLLLNQIETNIFENNEPNIFAPEYVKMCAAHMKAKYNLNSLPPNERWIRKFYREHLVRVGYKLYRCRSTIFGS